MTTALLLESSNKPYVEALPRVRYEIDSDHATASFKVRHLMVANVRGELGPIIGTALIDEQNLARSEVYAIIDATGIDTRNAQRDAHLKSADFLNVEAFPNIAFHSTVVVPGDDGELQVLGQLTIRGVTEKVVLDVELSDEVRAPDGTSKRGVTATARINRKDFGVSWNDVMDNGSIVVGDLVDITLELELVRRAPSSG